MEAPAVAGRQYEMHIVARTCHVIRLRKGPCSCAVSVEATRRATAKKALSSRGCVEASLSL